MSQNHSNSDDITQEELERLLTQGVESYIFPGDGEEAFPQRPSAQPGTGERKITAGEDEEKETYPDGDIQGALGLFAEAAQDMATSGVEFSLGRHFACVDFCNQAVEKAAQAVSLLRFGRRSMYDHDLRALGVLVGAPEEILVELAILTPFHPEAFHAETPPEEADEVISAEQAGSYIQSARRVLRWARAIVLNV